MSDLSSAQAQQRADRIQAFQQELAQLQAEQVLALEPAQRVAIDQHHRQLLAHYAATLDIDADPRSRQLSLGMRVASLFGALALASSLFFLFHQFWGLFTEVAQVAILLGTSLGSLALTLWLQVRDRSGYYSKLAALLCFVAFVLNLSLLGQTFNITPSDKALLPWAGLALLLAYQCNLRLLLAAGLLCVGGFIAARVGAWGKTNRVLSKVSCRASATGRKSYRSAPRPWSQITQASAVLMGSRIKGLVMAAPNMCGRSH